MIRPLMASKAPHPVIVKLKAWRTVHGLSQSQAVSVLVDAGLPIKIGTLQQWERARTSPQAVTSAALERFLSEQHETSTSQRTPAPIILRLKSWREANNLSQAEAVRVLASADPPNLPPCNNGKSEGVRLRRSRLRHSRGFSMNIQLLTGDLPLIESASLYSFTAAPVDSLGNAG